MPLICVQGVSGASLSATPERKAALRGFYEARGKDLQVYMDKVFNKIKADPAFQAKLKKQSDDLVLLEDEE